MRIDPVIKDETDPYKDLTNIEKKARMVAIALAFIGVFVWMFKIIF